MSLYIFTRRNTSEIVDLEKVKEMEKATILLIALIMIGVGFLSGCNEQTPTENSISNWEKEQAEIERLKDEFETAMESVAGDFVDESSGYNYDTSKVEEDYILNYSQTLFEQHSSLIYDNDDFCESDDTFAYQWKNCRDYVIEGLQYLVDKNFVEARWSLFSADNEILMTDYMGDYWSKQFGFEDGVVDILWDMGYGRN